MKVSTICGNGPGPLRGSQAQNIRVDSLPLTRFPSLSHRLPHTHTHADSYTQADRDSDTPTVQHTHTLHLAID